MNSAFEFIWCFSCKEYPTRHVGNNEFRGTVSNVLSGPSQGGKNEYSDIHAATFPLYLPSWAIGSFLAPSGSVYDPFLGSGTTLIAAHRLGRKAYGCELEPKYADVILRRAEAEGLDVRKEG
jgi:DNA modification methylase